MEEENVDFVALCDYLKDMAVKTNAGRACIDFTQANGDVYRIEYKRSKKG